MKRLGSSDISMVASQLILGASNTVDLMGFFVAPLFDRHSGTTCDEIMALTDARLRARAILRQTGTVVKSREDLFDRDGRMHERREGHWKVRMPPFVPPAHLLIVDSSVAIYADLAWTDKKDDAVYWVEAHKEVDTLQRLFNSAWSANTDLLYQDPFGGLTEEEEQHIITVSVEQWQQLIDELALYPARLHALSSRRFEELVAELMARDGMDVQLTPPQKDGGRDALAYLKTSAGEHLFYVECKRYSPDNPVGVRLVRELFGVVEAERATAGLLVTTSRFTDGALKFRESVRHRMSLKDFELLTGWLQQHSRK